MALNELYVCKTSELSSGEPFVFDLNDNEQIVIFKTDSGYFAVENRCPHAGAFLDEGEVNGNILTCIWHGWRFDLETGQSLEAYWARVKTYKILLKENALFVQFSETREF